MNGIEIFYNEVHQRVTDEIIRGLFFFSSVSLLRSKLDFGFVPCII